MRRVVFGGGFLLALALAGLFAATYTTPKSSGDAVSDHNEDPGPIELPLPSDDGPAQGRIQRRLDNSVFDTGTAPEASTADWI